MQSNNFEETLTPEQAQSGSSDQTGSHKNLTIQNHEANPVAVIREELQFALLQTATVLEKANTLVLSMTEMFSTTERIARMNLEANQLRLQTAKVSPPFRPAPHAVITDSKIVKQKVTCSQDKQTASENLDSTKKLQNPQKRLNSPNLQNQIQPKKQCTDLDMTKTNFTPENKTPQKSTQSKIPQTQNEDSNGKEHQHSSGTVFGTDSYSLGDAGLNKIHVKRDYKLTAKTDFELWFDYLKSELTTNDLIDVIDSSLSCPLELNQTLKGKRKAYVRDIIINHIDSKYHKRILGIFDPLEIISQLRLFKRGENNVTHSSIRSRLYSLKQGKNEPIESFIERFDSLIREYEISEGSIALTEQKKEVPFIRQ